MMEQSLHRQDSLSSRHALGVEVLSSAIGTKASSEGAVLSLVVIGMNLRCGTKGCAWMLRLNPLNPPVSLRPFDFHSASNPSRQTLR